MKKFEHKEYSPKDEKGGIIHQDKIEKINKFCEEGWELVSVTVTNHGGETYYFKRQKE